MDAELAAYLDRVVERLRGLEAVWLIGSAATGAYVAGRSDVDVIGISAGALAEEEGRALATDISLERLACPARKLELAVYTRASVERPTADLQPEPLDENICKLYLQSGTVYDVECAVKENNIIAWRVVT